jgi:hypothetical protein
MSGLRVMEARKARFIFLSLNQCNEFVVLVPMQGTQHAKLEAHRILLTIAVTAKFSFPFF